MKKNMLADIDIDNIIKTSLKKSKLVEGTPINPPKGARTNCRDCNSPNFKCVQLDDDIEYNIMCTCQDCGHTWYLNSKKVQFSESYVAQPKSYSQVTEFVSQPTKESHSELYKGYVEGLNKVSAELDTADKAETNSHHSSFRSLKLDEAYNLNAVWLHELYFANCFDPNSEVYMDSMAYLRLQRDFGTFDDWQKDFLACGLSAGEGWVVCGYNMFLKRYVNTVVSHHSQDVMMGLYPIVVVDMWSHSYFKDYLNDKKSYLISQMREINWNIVEERFRKAESIHEILK